MMCRCECGWPVYSRGKSITLTCPQCGDTIVCDGTESVVSAVPLRKWPVWAKTWARLRKSSDIGVGDTVQRVAAWLGAEMFKKMADKTGIPCGCTERQAAWNELYPYDA